MFIYNYKLKKLNMNIFNKIKPFIIILLILNLSYIYKNSSSYKYEEKLISKDENIIIDTNSYCNNSFSKEEFILMIKKMNLKFPHIVYAQSILETGYWESKIFKENNNLFGMKRARSRPTTSFFEKNEHAYYSNWKESLYDYMIYQSTYLSKYKNEKDYIEYLNKNYAQDPNYLKKLNYIIRKENLVEKFNKL